MKKLMLILGVVILANVGFAEDNSGAVVVIGSQGQDVCAQFSDLDDMYLGKMMQGGFGLKYRPDGMVHTDAEHKPWFGFGFTIEILNYIISTESTTYTYPDGTVTYEDLREKNKKALVGIKECYKMYYSGLTAEYGGRFTGKYKTAQGFADEIQEQLNALESSSFNIIWPCEGKNTCLRPGVLRDRIDGYGRKLIEVYESIVKLKDLLKQLDDGTGLTDGKE